MFATLVARRFVSVVRPTGLEKEIKKHINLKKGISLLIKKSRVI